MAVLFYSFDVVPKLYFYVFSVVSFSLSCKSSPEILSPLVKVFIQNCFLFFAFSI